MNIILIEFVENSGIFYFLEMVYLELILIFNSNKFSYFKIIIN